MPRYLIERHFGHIATTDLDEPEWVARRDAAARQYPEIAWEHSHVIETDDGLITYCIYQAPDPQYVRDHATAAGVPCDAVTECLTVAPDVSPPASTRA